jgi:hypothetical protein
MTKALLLLGLGFALAACNGEDEKPGDTQNSCEAPEGERGTAECKRYHAAYCDLASQCGQELCDCIDQTERRCLRFGRRGDALRQRAPVSVLLGGARGVRRS